MTDAEDHRRSRSSSARAGSARRAPKTCAAFERLLPFRNKIIHVRWSGESAWIPLGDMSTGLEFENHTSHPAPGEILLYPGGYSETEILFPYGGTLFASIVGPARRQPLPHGRRGPRAAARARAHRAVGGRAGHRLRGGLIRVPSMASPEWVEPMLATLSDERELGEDWLLERKLDGVRCLAFVQAGAVVLRSRNRLPLAFPGIAQALEPLGDAIVDGEIVAVDRRRQAARVPGAAATRHRGAVGVRPRSGTTATTSATSRSTNATPRSRPPRGRSGAPGQRARRRAEPRRRYRRACAAGWEGLIAKREDAPVPRRPLARLAQAQVRARAGGRRRRLHRAARLPRRDRRAADRLLRVRSAALRRQGRHRLRHRHARWRCAERLEPLETTATPFDEPVKPLPRAPTGSRPALVAQVGFAEWTAAGRMRQPRYLGLRDDKAAEPSCANGRPDRRPERVRSAVALRARSRGRRRRRR